MRVVVIMWAYRKEVVSLHCSAGAGKLRRNCDEMPKPRRGMQNQATMRQESH
jgi:hypothetical protein